jgi:hypothetical protein
MRSEVCAAQQRQLKLLETSCDVLQAAASSGRSALSETLHLKVLKNNRNGTSCRQSSTPHITVDLCLQLFLVVVMRSQQVRKPDWCQCTDYLQELDRGPIALSRLDT